MYFKEKKVSCHIGGMLFFCNKILNAQPSSPLPPFIYLYRKMHLIFLSRKLLKEFLTVIERTRCVRRLCLFFLDLSTWTEFLLPCAFIII